MIRLQKDSIKLFAFAKYIEKERNMKNFLSIYEINMPKRVTKYLLDDLLQKNIINNDFYKKYIDFEYNDLRQMELDKNIILSNFKKNTPTSTPIFVL